MFDDDYLVSQEELTAHGEQRFVGTGMDAHGRILTVLYTMPHEEAIHLISARRATKRETDFMGNTDNKNAEEIPEVRYDPVRAKRGALNPLPPTKERITIRLDKDILAWFKRRVHEQGGGNYQTLMNEALREYIEGHGTLEAMLRRVVREELHQMQLSHMPHES